MKPLLIALALLLMPLTQARAAPGDPLRERKAAREAAARVPNYPWQGYDRARLTILAGLIQPILLRGGNLELDFHYKRFVVSYSHGFLLKLQGNTVVGDVKKQGLRLDIPYSTGVGVGFRFTRWLDVRLEPKVHRFEVTHDRTGQHLFGYNTVTLGLGVYAVWRPFADFGLHLPAWTHGFQVSTSLRYWPNVWSGLGRDRRDYVHPSGATQTHDAAKIGIANTPVIFNVALGYGFYFTPRKAKR